MIDVGFGTVTAAAQPAIVTGTAFSPLRSVVGSKAITINDGATSKTVTLNAATYTTLGGSATSASNAAVNATDVVAMINATLTAPHGQHGLGLARRRQDDVDQLVLDRLIIVSAADAALRLHERDHQRGAGGTVVVRTASGTNAGTTTAQGILDTANNTYTNTSGGSYSIANFNISTLVGTNGDLDLGLIISAVDKAIGKVTDAGTKLGANKTQIDGQKTFVDTLMKANDRTIGILVDADVEEESTKLKALQTQQQLAVQALSIANSSSQNVLSLFR